MSLRKLFQIWVTFGKSIWSVSYGMKTTQQPVYTSYRNTKWEVTIKGDRRQRSVKGPSKRNGIKIRLSNFPVNLWPSFLKKKTFLSLLKQNRKHRWEKELWTWSGDLLHHFICRLDVPVFPSLGKLKEQLLQVLPLHLGQAKVCVLQDAWRVQQHLEQPTEASKTGINKPLCSSKETPFWYRCCQCPLQKASWLNSFFLFLPAAETIYSLNVDEFFFPLAFAKHKACSISEMCHKNWHQHLFTIVGQGFSKFWIWMSCEQSSGAVWKLRWTSWAPVPKARS